MRSEVQPLIKSKMYQNIYDCFKISTQLLIKKLSKIHCPPPPPQGQGEGLTWSNEFWHVWWVPPSTINILAADPASSPTPSRSQTWFLPQLFEQKIGRGSLAYPERPKEFLDHVCGWIQCNGFMTSEIQPLVKWKSFFFKMYQNTDRFKIPTWLIIKIWSNMKVLVNIAYFCLSDQIPKMVDFSGFSRCFPCKFWLQKTLYYKIGQNRSKL